MLRYAAGRIVLTVPVLFGVSLLSFAIIHLIPGDIVSVLAGPMVAPDSEAAQNIRRALHLDQPLPVQYGLWLIGALHGDFGNSLVMGLPVGPQIASHLPVTLVLTARVADLRDHDRIARRRRCCDGTRTLARSRHSRRCAARPLDAAFLRRRCRGVAALDLSAFVQDPWRRRPASRSARRTSRPCCCRPSSFRWLPPRRSCATRASPCSKCWRSLTWQRRAPRAPVVSAC